MNILEKYTTGNPCYQSGKPLTVKGLMLHSVGCAQPSASVFYNSFNHSVGACVHAFIDANTGDVWQTLPWDMRGWHCASGSNGSGNNTHIGVEMCQTNHATYINGYSFNVPDGKLGQARQQAMIAYESAVELFAQLCKQFKLNPIVDGVVISHAEGHKRGIASNHGDPESYWKNLGLDLTMNQFRQDVAARMKQQAMQDILPQTKEPWYRVRKAWKDVASQVGAFHNLDIAKQCCDGHEGTSVYNDNGDTVYCPYKAVETVNTPVVAETTVQTENLVKKAQNALNRYFGFELVVDGICGNKTLSALRQAIQIALNLDMRCGLAVDGDIGYCTKRELGKLNIQYRAVGYVVTVVEIAMYLHGIDANGIEYPGQVGTGLCNAVMNYQKQNGLTVNGNLTAETLLSIFQN